MATLTRIQRIVLLNIKESRASRWGPNMRVAVCGYPSTMKALHRRGLVDDKYQITQAGRDAI